MSGRMGIGCLDSDFLNINTRWALRDHGTIATKTSAIVVVVVVSYSSPVYLSRHKSDDFKFMAILLFYPN